MYIDICFDRYSKNVNVVDRVEFMTLQLVSKDHY